jgi:hypothetical protein
MAAAAGGHDVDVRLGADLPADIATAPSEIQPSSRDDDPVQQWALDVGGHRYLRLRYPLEPLHVDFVIDGEGTRVWALGAGSIPTSDVTSLLLGPVLGRVLRLRGLLCLHASVVAVGGRALAVVGHKGAGKSTVAAGLAAAGHGVLADDIAVVTGGQGTLVVHPGYARLRLWNPAIEAFVGSRDTLSRVVSVRNKRFLDLSTDDRAPWRFQSRPLPLAAVYVLGPRRPEDVPGVTPLSPSAALMVLGAHGYASDTLTTAGRAREFDALADLVRRVPVRTVHRPDEIAAVPRVCAAIVADVERLGAPGRG